MVNPFPLPLKTLRASSFPFIRLFFKRRRFVSHICLKTQKSRLLPIPIPTPTLANPRHKPTGRKNSTRPPPAKAAWSTKRDPKSPADYAAVAQGKSQAAGGDRPRTQPTRRRRTWKIPNRGWRPPSSSVYADLSPIYLVPFATNLGPC